MPPLLYVICSFQNGITGEDLVLKLRSKTHLLFFDNTNVKNNIRIYKYFTNKNKIIYTPLKSHKSSNVIFFKDSSFLFGPLITL